MANSSMPHYQNSSLFRRGKGTVKVENYSEGNNKTWEGKKLVQRCRRGHWTQEEHQLGFSYLSASLRYYLSKVKAFYRRFFLEAVELDAMGRHHEVMLVDPYFSFPVVPAATFAPF